MKIEMLRTCLRRFAADDLANMQLLELDAEVMKFTSLRVPLSPEQSKARLDDLLQNGVKGSPLGIWAAEHRETGEFIGWFMLAPTNLEFPEIGFMIRREFWGQGLTTEICQGLIRSAVNELKIPGVAAVTDPSNAASMRVLEKIGFQYSGKIMRLNRYEGRDIELNLFTLRTGLGLEE
jgi:RimJ/RimL family protein N-acetyltransferase